MDTVEATTNVSTEYEMLGIIYANDNTSLLQIVTTMQQTAPDTTMNLYPVYEIPVREVTILEIAIAFVCVFAIFVNICVLLVIFIGPRAFRTPTFFFISSLASADLLTGVAVMCAIFIPVGDGAWQRIVLKGIAVVSFSASVNNLMVIAGERYLKIHDEQRYSKVFNNGNSAIFIAASWLFAFTLFLVGPLLGWSCGDVRCMCRSDNMCKCDVTYCSQSFSPFSKSYLIVGVTYFYVSLFVMVILYSAIFVSVRRRSRFKQKRGGSVVGLVPNRGPFVMIHRRREIRLAKTLVIVLGVFFVCWLPITTLFVVDSATQSTSLMKVFDYCLISAVVHPLVNPIIYSMRLPRMWATFKYLAYALWRRIFRTRTSHSSFQQTPGIRHRNSCCTKAKTSCPSSLHSQQDFTPQSQTFNDRKSTSLSASTQASPIQEQIIQTNDKSEEIGRQLLNSFESGHCANNSTNLAGKVKEKPIIHCHTNQVIDNKSKKLVRRQLSLSQIDHNFGTCPKSPRTSSCAVKLANGRLVPKGRVKISSPFNAENKLSWD